MKKINGKGKQMSEKIYLWIEDRTGKASYKFWNTFLEQLYPEIIVESKKNSSELVKAVKKLENNFDKYIIIYDNSFDNIQVVMERKLLQKYANEKDNVILMDFICFEYILLEFHDLLNWIYASDDEFREKRAGVIKAREKLVKAVSSGELDYKAIQEVIGYDDKIKEHNIEQLAAKMLFDLTRNTGFEVSKGNIGDCWIKSCCEWDSRVEDDICGLDDHRLTIYDKMKSIYKGTSIQAQFQTAGLEAVV